MFNLTKHGETKLKHIIDSYPTFIKNNYIEKYLKICKEYDKEKIKRFKKYDIDPNLLKEINIPYFCYDRWNYDQAFFICLYSNLFKFSNNENIGKNLLTVNNKIKKWNTEELLNMIYWLKQKPDLKLKKHDSIIENTLLRYQILDSLFNFKVTTLNLEDWSKKKTYTNNNITNKYLFVDWNLILDKEVTKYIEYRNSDLKICSNSYSMYEISITAMNQPRNKVLNEIIKNLKTSKRSLKSYYNLDTFSLINPKKIKENFLCHDNPYCLLSNNFNLYQAYIEQLNKLIKPYIFRLNENIEIIKSNLKGNSFLGTEYVKGMTFVNIDSFKQNKTTKMNISYQYLITSDDIEKFNYFLSKLEKDKTVPKLNGGKTKINIISDRISNEKKKRSKMPPTTREEVWKEHNGNTFDGKCFSCDVDLKYKDHDCGHVKADAKGGSRNPSNLRPICRSCNLSMGTENMFEWMRRNCMKGCKNLK